MLTLTEQAQKNLDDVRAELAAELEAARTVRKQAERRAKIAARIAIPAILILVPFTITYAVAVPEHANAVSALVLFLGVICALAGSRLQRRTSQRSK